MDRSGSERISIERENWSAAEHSRWRNKQETTANSADASLFAIAGRGNRVEKGACTGRAAFAGKVRRGASSEKQITRGGKRRYRSDVRTEGKEGF